METAKKHTEENNKHDKNEVVVDIDHISKSFGSKVVLTDINLQLKRGENVVVLGKSGQGKSVTIQCIVGLLTPDNGAVKVFGDDVAEMNEEQLKELRTKVPVPKRRFVRFHDR